MPKTRKPSDPKSGHQPKLHDEQLAAVWRLVRQLEGIVDGLIKACPESVIETKSQYEETVLALVSLLALAQRRIIPAALKEQASGIILSQIAADLIVDESQFARKLVGIAAGCLTASPGLISSLKAILAETGSQELLSDSMIVGWAYQCLIFQSRNSFADKGQFQQLSASDIAFADLPVLTQWFTPEWISSFLVGETFKLLEGKSEVSIIDPCLGAGHIFVEALKQRLRQLNHVNPADALAKILSDELFGCDIDKKVVEIAGFSIYLVCRDLAPICELPLPQIFHFDGKGFASLWLSVKGRPAIEISGPAGSFELLHLEKSYSAVITNPPYLSHRLMPKELSVFLKKTYPAGRFDLYAAFLKLSMNLVADSGVFALICQQSFMSITRYEELREELLDRFALKMLVQLGSGVFASRKGEKVSNAIVVAQAKSSSEDITEGWRILTAHEQKTAQRLGIRQLPKLENKTQSFQKFPGKQFAFWCPDELLPLFDLPALESEGTGIESSNGLFTCNNKQFLKFFWQIEENESCHFVPYDKGGGYKWHYTTPLRINWQDKGDQIRAYRKERGQSVALPGEKYYFKSGVTYSYIGTRGFKARLLSPGSVFDVASSALFCHDPLYLLGFLNSSLARFLLGVLNPTVNFQIGDLRRLPYKKPSESTRKIVTQAVTEAVELARRLETFDSRSPSYRGATLLRYTSEDSHDELMQACHSHREHLVEINEQEALLQKRIDVEIFRHYSISEKMQVLIESDPWVIRNEKFIDELPTDKQLLAELDAIRTRK
ncbi:MAG: N-6 DNA methylase [Candidatus Obscuribacterales bacterium]|nr:N-6 DNA methylase [Candidatus Obscuribacterales bacterium]